MAKELFELLTLINPRLIKKKNNPTCKVTDKLRLTLVFDNIQERLAGKTISKESKEQVIQSILYFIFLNLPQKFYDITNLIQLPNLYKSLQKVLHNFLRKISCT